MMLSERLGVSSRALSQTFRSEVDGLRSEMRQDFALIRREESRADRAILEDVQQPLGSHEGSGCRASQGGACTQGA